MSDQEYNERMLARLQWFTVAVGAFLLGAAFGVPLGRQLELVRHIEQDAEQVHQLLAEARSKVKGIGS